MNFIDFYWTWWILDLCDVFWNLQLMGSREVGSPVPVRTVVVVIAYSAGLQKHCPGPSSTSSAWETMVHMYHPSTGGVWMLLFLSLACWGRQVCVYVCAQIESLDGSVPVCLMEDRGRHSSTSVCTTVEAHHLSAPVQLKVHFSFTHDWPVIYRV